MLKLWKHITEIGVSHGVNPVVFAVLYLAHHPLFWGTVAWIAIRARRRQVVWPHVMLASIFWIMPYTYLIFSARHLPWWIVCVIVLFLTIGAFHAVLEVRKRIRNAAGAPKASDAGQV